MLWDRRGGVAASEGLARGLQRLRESRGQGGLIKFIVAFIQIWLGMCEYSFGEEQLELSGQCVLLGTPKCCRGVRRTREGVQVVRVRRDVGLVRERVVPGRTDAVRIVSCWISRTAVPHEDGVVKPPRCAGRCRGCKRQGVCEYVFGEERLSAVVCVPAAGPGCPRGRSISKFVVVLVRECLDFCIKVDEVTVESRGTTRRSNDSVWLLIP